MFRMTKRWFGFVSAMFFIVGLLSYPPQAVSCCPSVQKVSCCDSPEHTAPLQLACCQEDWSQQVVQPGNNLVDWQASGAVHLEALTFSGAQESIVQLLAQGFTPDESDRYLRLRVLLN